MNRLNKLKCLFRAIGSVIVVVFCFLTFMIYKYVDGIEREAKNIMYFLNGIILLAGIFVYMMSFHIRMCLEKEKEKRENKNENEKKK